MGLRLKYATQIAGGLVIFSVIILALSVFFIGKSQNWFEKSFVCKTILDESYGISPGAKISMKGMYIGNIIDISLNPDTMIVVTMKINGKFQKYIRANSVVVVKKGFIGGGSVSISIGNPKERMIEDGGFVLSQDLQTAKELFEEGKVDVKADDMKQLLKNLVQITDLFKYKNSPLYQTLVNVQNITYRISRLLSQRGSLTRFVADNNVLFNKIMSILGDINNMTKNLADMTLQSRSLIPSIIKILDATKSSLEELKRLLIGIQNNPFIKEGMQKRQKTEKRKQIEIDTKINRY